MIEYLKFDAMLYHGNRWLILKYYRADDIIGGGMVLTSWKHLERAKVKLLRDIMKYVEKKYVPLYMRRRR